MEMPDEVSGRQVVLWALIGSHNYGLETESSDEDHMAFVAPTFEDLYRGRAYHAQSVTLTDDVVVHDVRKVPDLLWKSNPSFMEVLFSRDLRVPGTFAAPYINRIVRMRDRIAAMNLPVFWRTTMGIHTGRLGRMGKGTESTMPLVERYGYDTKQAMHVVRSLLVLEKFAGNGFTDFGSAITATPAERKLLLEIKSGRYTLEEFREMDAETLSRVEALRPLYESVEPDREAFEIVDATVMDLVRDAIDQEQTF